MKKWLLIFLLLQSVVVLLAQNPVFQLDSLPSEGIQLRKGWKFHAGDNPEWAKTDFDDSKWEAIVPSEDLGDLPQIRKEAVGWFGGRFQVDSSLLNKPLTFQVYQCIVENNSSGKGRRNIAERVKSLNGTWEVKTAKGNGVMNEINVPVYREKQ